jgi:PAS domain S-box-containing protein
MSKGRILIVEDEAIVAEDLRRKLGRLDYAVCGWTGSGEEAVALARKGGPDLVLMDIRLEAGMDGVEAAQRIRQECDVPVVYLTAHSDPTTLQRAKLTEPYGYILKPFETRELESHIQIALYKHQAEAEVRRQREWLQVTLQSIGDGVITTDAAGKVTSLNPVAQEMTGWKTDEALNRPLQEVFNIINQETRRPGSHPVERVLREGKVVGLANHTALISRDGTERAIDDSAAPIRDSQGRILGVVMVFHEVTEKRRAEQALRESEERFRVAQELSPDGFTILRPVRDAQGGIVDFTWVYENDAIARMNGTKPSAVLGRRLLEVFPGHRGTQFFKRYQQVAETGARCVFEEQYRGESLPKPTWFRIAVVPLGRDIAILAQDVTKQKEFQAELERLVAERTAKLQELVGELEHFSYTITHDMRAPLRAMQGFAGMMEETCAQCQKHEAKDFLHRIGTSAARMDLLITDALSYSRTVRQELTLAPVDAAALLRGILDSYPELQPSKAQIRLEGEIPLVMGNEAGLTQCFSNVLGNAVKFVKPGQRPEICVRAERREGWVRIWVEDNGIGIPEVMLSRVFDMFARGHNDENYEGTGIGLALVRKVMRQMGGKVGVESEEAKGSRFWLDLRPGDTTMRPCPSG